ncbi:hypothetical protein DVH24_038905 [Malus domestica]|uniref:Uncharacterized protein n=1 Tax=Malus domestica TaxID=3750 RepID=A0A498KB23_MALDO|nr:hypothetical protein DVH24_038905 [Malus domestica]
MASYSQSAQENAKLKAFPIFPSGIRYMPGKIRDKPTFSILFQNFPEDKSSSNLACKSDDMFPKTKTKKESRIPPCHGKSKGE